MKGLSSAGWLAFLVCFGWGTPALAVRQPDHRVGRPSFEVAQGQPVRVVRRVTADPSHLSGHQARAWRKFEGAVGGTWRALWDRATGVPLRIYGSGLSAPGSVASGPVAAAYAWTLLSRHLALLAPGASDVDFVLVANEVHHGVRSVGFYQLHRGRRVLTGQLSFRFKRDRMIAFASEALPWVDAPVDVAWVSRSVAEDAAQAWIWNDLGWSTDVMTSEGLAVLPLIRPRGISYATVWSVTVRSDSPRARWVVYIDAYTGQPVARHQTLRYYSGQLLYDAPIRYPLAGRQDYPAQYADVTVGTVPATTDIDGMVTFSATNISLTAGARGPYAVVVNDAGSDATVTLSLDASDTTGWSDPDSELVDAQIASFVHANEIKVFARRLNPTLSWFDDVITVHVNGDGDCNAMSDGDNIYFLLGSSQCENTGRVADVMYHEFGHSLHAQSIIWGAGAFDEALSEGLADFLSATFTGDPGMGRGFFTSDGNYPLRHIDPSDKEYVWPSDVSPDSHQTGLILSGAFWDLRKDLVATYGETDGVELVNRLYYAAMQRASDIPSSYVEALVEDDDDGDLSNGTPNACAIREHFGSHGLTGGDSLFGGLYIRRPVASGLDVSIAIEVPTDGCEHASVVAVTLDWDLRNAPMVGADLEMTADGSELYVASIPIEGEALVARYQVRVELSDGTVKTYPENPADTMYETYVGEVLELYCTQFVATPFDNGWTHGLTSGQTSEGADDWQWGPSLAGSSAADPGAPFIGDNVIGNDLGGGTYNGLYQPDKVNYALSPLIDATGFDRVRLQYRRWLNVEDAYYDKATIYANDEVAWRNLNSNMGQGSNTHHADREWRFHDVDLTPFLDADGRVEVRFEIDSDGGLEFGGWTLDDFCVVGVIEPRCGDGDINTSDEDCDDGVDNSDTEPDACRLDCQVAVCGDGVVDTGEQCDDGNNDEQDDCLADCTLAENGVSPGGCGCRTDDRSTPVIPIGWGLFLLGLLLLRRSR
jgi:MYXO-CTERM domain-containing protein